MIWDVSKFVAFDTETHKVQPGLKAPPIVCSSSARYGRTGELRREEESLDFFDELMKSDATIVLANAPFDFLVMAVEFARRRQRDIMPEIFELYESRRVYDVTIAQALDAIGEGCLSKDPRGGSLINPATGRVTNQYALATCVMLEFGRTDAKVNDFWRGRYALLQHLPTSEWPWEARQYPIDDAENTVNVAVHQVERDAMNLHDLAFQCYADWALHLGDAWGFNIGRETLYRLKERVEREFEDNKSRFIEAGILRPNGTKDTAWFQHLVADAYGASGTCATCKGKGKVSSPQTGKPINCPKVPAGCAGTGFDMSDAPMVPLAEKGGITTARDVLYDSGNDLLIDWAHADEETKSRTTFIPLMEAGFSSDGRAIPVTLNSNVIVNSGRVSVKDGWHSMPRKGDIRECVEARPGMMLWSSDWSGAELVTHGQSCLWLLGYSNLAKALRDGIKPHDALGARISGVPYEEFLKRRKSEEFLDACRQASKIANFGFPGMMGPFRLVLQQRAIGPDTAHPDGPHLLEDEDGKTYRGYHGLRFCILTGGSDRCGSEMITEWYGRHYSPACKRCVEEAAKLRVEWYAQWPENHAYKKEISKLMDSGQPLIQHVTGRIRGDVTFTSAANGYFQSLAAEAAKLANIRVQRECLTDKRSPLYGGRSIILLHDELLGEALEDRAAEAAVRVGEIMVSTMSELCPDVPNEAEPCLMRKWYKSAEPVFDANKRLIPWEPEPKVAA